MKEHDNEYNENQSRAYRGKREAEKEREHR
jgi:hypothetical protein